MTIRRLEIVRLALVSFALALAPLAASAQEEDPGMGPPETAPRAPATPPSAPPPPRASAPPAAAPPAKAPSPAAAAKTVETEEGPVKETVKEETKVLPRTAMSDDEWESHLLAPTLTGGIGLFRTQTAEVGPPLHLRVGLHAQAFTQDNLLISGSNGMPGDHDDRFMGDLTFGITGPDVLVLRNLEFYLGLFNSSNENARTDTGRTDPSVILALADVAFGLRGAYEVLRGFSVGGNFGVRFFNSISGVAANVDATNFDVNAVASFDLRKYVASVPLRFHVNIGYLEDRSLNLLPPGQCAGQTGNTACIRSRVVETFAYGLDAPRARIALAVDAPLRFHVPWGIFGVEPLFEYHLEVATGGGDPVIANALMNDPSVSRARLTNTVSQFATVGVRARPIGGLVIDFGLDFALQSPGFQYGPAIPVWNIIAGAAYAFDTTGPVTRLTTRTVTRTVEVGKKSSESHLAITVLDAKTRKPVGGALVAWPGRGLSMQATSDDGKVMSYGLPPGPVSVEVSASGYEGETAETSVEADTTRPLEVLLKPRPAKDGKLHIRVIDDKGAPLPGAQVKVAGGVTKDAIFAGDGFEASVPAGDYTVSVEAPGYLAREKEVGIQAGQEMNVEFTLHKRPNKSHVELAGNQILIKGTIHFATNEATILPDGQQVLDEVIDLLAKNPQIKKVSVEGHTDNQGNPAHNLQLSKDRAAAVVAYMVRNGIPKERLTSEGYGQTRPLVPNLGAANKAKNRRVEFHITEQTGAAGAKPDFRE